MRPTDLACPNKLLRTKGKPLCPNSVLFATQPHIQTLVSQTDSWMWRYNSDQMSCDSLGGLLMRYLIITSLPRSLGLALQCQVRTSNHLRAMGTWPQVGGNVRSDHATWVTCGPRAHPLTDSRSRDPSVL